MDLAARLACLVVLAVAITISSIIAAALRHRAKALYRFNSALLSFFGVEPNHPLGIKLVAGWLVTTGVATLLMVLAVNLIESLLLLAGLSGMALDAYGAPVLLGVVVASVFIIAPALLPVIAEPPSAPTALAILAALHIYGFHYVPGLPLDIAEFLVVASTFVFFCAVAVGVVGATLSVYLVLRSYLVPAVLFRRSQETPANSSASTDKSP